MRIDRNTWVRTLVDRHTVAEAVLGDLGVDLGPETMHTTLLDLCEVHGLDLDDVLFRLRGAVLTGTVDADAYDESAPPRRWS